MTVEKAKYQGVKYLSYRPRTTQEVILYLQKKQYGPEIIGEVIPYLKNLSYLDDNKFCEMWIESRSRLKPKGRKALIYELKSKGIADSIIEENISQNFPEETEQELAKELALKKIQNLDLNSPKTKEKIMAYLHRKGFTNNVIYNIMNEIDRLCSR